MRQKIATIFIIISEIASAGQERMGRDYPDSDGGTFGHSLLTLARFGLLVLIIFIIYSYFANRKEREQKKFTESKASGGIFYNFLILKDKHSWYRVHSYGKTFDEAFSKQNIQDIKKTSNYDLLLSKKYNDSENIFESNIKEVTGYSKTIDQDIKDFIDSGWELIKDSKYIQEKNKRDVANDILTYAMTMSELYRQQRKNNSADK